MLLSFRPAETTPLHLMSFSFFKKFGFSLQLQILLNGFTYCNKNFTNVIFTIQVKVFRLDQLY